MVAALLGPGKENFKPLVVPAQCPTSKDDYARRWSSWRGRQGGNISTSDKEANDEFLTFNKFSLERKTCFTHFLLQGTAV